MASKPFLTGLYVRAWTFPDVVLYKELYVRRMAERSGGNVPPPCVSCRKPLPNPGARFCASCGAPQQPVRRCIACGAPMIPGAPHCVFCGTDQNNPVQCVNPLCRKLLVPSMTVCYVCGTPRMQGTASFYQVPQSEGDPSSFRGTHPWGHPPPSGIHTQAYPGMGLRMASMPYSPATHGELQVISVTF